MAILRENVVEADDKEFGWSESWQQCSVSINRELCGKSEGAASNKPFEWTDRHQIAPATTASLPLKGSVRPTKEPL